MESKNSILKQTISIQNGGKGLVEVKISTKRISKLICGTSKSFMNTSAVPQEMILPSWHLLAQSQQ